MPLLPKETDKLLDEIGWKILGEMQRNGRITYALLGQRVGLSIPAVTERVRKMEEAGIILGYRAEINPAAVGYPITAFIRMSITGDYSHRIGKIAEEMAEVFECHRGTGGDSFIMKVRVSSVSHLEKVIEKLLPYGTTTTSIVLSSPVTRRFVERHVEEKPPGKGRRTRQG